MANPNDKMFATFERRQELEDYQNELLAIDLHAEPREDEDTRERTIVEMRIVGLLAEYQEQPYLLDPHLEGLVGGVVDAFKRFAATYDAPEYSKAESSYVRIQRLSLVIYQYIKFRGHKTIIRYFPHEVADLSIALKFMTSSDSPTQRPGQWQWTLRYVTLLWLSLIVRIPFDLSLFDPEDQPFKSADTLQSLGEQYLSKAGLERSAAALLLARLFMRKDLMHRFSAFIDISRERLIGNEDPFASLGRFQVLCEVVKSAPSEHISTDLHKLLELAHAVHKSEATMRNSTARKLQTKLLSRCIVRMLPAPTKRVHKKRLDPRESEQILVTSEDELDVPEDVEGALEQLFISVQDRETVVRWSSAKGIARIADRLPSDFTDQVLDQVLSLYSIHSAGTASIYNLPAISEPTWHGATLATAELARRGTVSDERLSDLIKWYYKALYFDIRVGAHSIGSNVRDATAYGLWSLARAQAPPSLAPFASELSQHLMTISLYDREIHVRRAASAAFQEYAGRTNLFPHGIDVLKHADFFSIGMRRSAFLVSAPEIARHIEYRPKLIEHVLDVTLRHWDPEMRSLGAQSLKLICEIDLITLGPDVMARTHRLLQVGDTNDVHGGILAVKELAEAFQMQPHNHSHVEQAFSCLALVPTDTVLSSRNPLITEAACLLISKSITTQQITLGPKSVAPHWRKVVDFGLKHRSESVQVAAASAMGSVSSLVDCASILTRWIAEYQQGSPTLQKSLGRLLGVLDYKAYPTGLKDAVECLLSSVDPASPIKMENIEARRNAFKSIPRLINNVIDDLLTNLDSTSVRRLFDAMITGLQDYTTDERGDVGSWVRSACIEGITAVSETLFTHEHTQHELEKLLPPASYHSAIGGILKQGLERLDNVRQTAGEQLMRLIRLPLPRLASEPKRWQLHGEKIIKNLYTEEGAITWHDSSWLFPRAMHLLEIEQYRGAVLDGLLSSIASKTDSTQRPASAFFIAYTERLPLMTKDETQYSILALVQDLLGRANANFASNSVVIPVLQAFDILLDADALDRLQDSEQGIKALHDIQALTTRNAAKLKSPQRIQLCMRIVTRFLPLRVMYEKTVAYLPIFLGHQYPKIRADTAERLYIVLQTKDIDRETDEIEEILLETEWAVGDSQTIRDTSERVRGLFLSDARAED